MDYTFDVPALLTITLSAGGQVDAEYAIEGIDGIPLDNFPTPAHEGEPLPAGASIKRLEYLATDASATLVRVSDGRSWIEVGERPVPYEDLARRLAILEDGMAKLVKLANAYERAADGPSGDAHHRAAAELADEVTALHRRAFGAHP